MLLKPILDEPEIKERQNYAQETEQKEEETGAVLDPEVVANILNSAGISKPSINDANDELRESFNRIGATIDEVARNIFNISCRGESETARLTASKFIAEIHGVKTKLEESASEKTQITININGSENKNLISLVMPR